MTLLADFIDSRAAIAPFGASLHVVGRHKQTLMTSVNRVAQSTGVTVTPTETSLEDVFIQLMGQSKDNML